MTSNTPTTEPTPEAPKAEGPGKLLKSAREQANKSVDEVASRLKISPELLKGIEQNDYAKAPAFTFVRGYLRAYSAYLKFTPEQSNNIIAKFNEMNLEENETGRPRQPLMYREATLNDGPVRWVSYLLVTTLLILVLMWWKAQQHSSNQLTSLLPKLTMQKVIDSPAATEHAATAPDTNANQTTNQGDTIKPTAANDKKPTNSSTHKA